LMRTTSSGASMVSTASRLMKLLFLLRRFGVLCGNGADLLAYC
jgi:hypothetical protein